MDTKRLCMLFFCFLLAVVSSVKELNDIEDLKNVGRQTPRHRLQLLFWFSQRVRNIDQNGILTLDSNLDPTRRDFGFHPFKNRESILPTEGAYYSVGNLNSPGANALPVYVRGNRNTRVPEANMDRLMISVDPNFPNRVFNVYITSHNRGSNDFNSEETYEINSDLIREMQIPVTCTENVYDHTFTFTHHEENERWLNFLNNMGNNNGYNIRRLKRFADHRCDVLEEFQLEIRANNNGYSKLIWKDLPAKLLEEYYVYIEICKNDHNTNECQSEQKVRVKTSSGTLDTSVYLNGNLQPQLQLSYYWENKLTCYGPELDDANGVMPTRIKWCDASLQLYTEGGYASARLYIKKTHIYWKTEFYYSWVGFYSSSQTSSDSYYTYQYATYFKKVEDKIEDYDIYKYQSSLAIAPGVQIRFLLDKEYYKVLAQTTPWEDAEQVMISPSDCIPNSKISV